MFFTENVPNNVYQKQKRITVTTVFSHKHIINTCNCDALNLLLIATGYALIYVSSLAPEGVGA